MQRALWYVAKWPEWCIRLSARNTCNFTASARHCAATSTSSIARAIEPSWFTPISAITSVGSPGPTDLPNIVNGFMLIRSSLFILQYITDRFSS